ncbi:MAG: GxxExxY protein, partial [Barnesiella sp.]|nr:GxxExxY protein [Barnesiella sp.]
MNSPKNLNRITHDIIKVAFDVRNQYGRLMLESLYEQVFAIELTMLGYKVERQVPLD